MRSNQDQGQVGNGRVTIGAFGRSATLPRYFFHSADGLRERDMEGTELPSHAAARIEAIKVMGAIVNDQPEVLWDGRDFRIEVTNEAGALLFTIVTLAIDAPASEGS